MKSLSRFPSSPATTHHHPRHRPLRQHIFSASIPKRRHTAAAHPSLSAQQQNDVKPMVVVGSANADIYVEIDRLPMVGETISARTGQTLAGGKGANQACCGGKLAHPTYFVGQVGEDAHGRLIEEALEGGGVMLGHLSRVPAAPTGHAVVMLQPDGQNSIIIVGGANMCYWPERLLEEDLEVIRRAGVLLLQREIPDCVNIQVAEAAKSGAVPVILDAGGMEGPIPMELLNLVDIFSPNETELARLTGLPTETFKQLCQAVQKCYEMEDETLDHLFATCSYSQQVWGDLARRLQVTFRQQSSVQQLIFNWGRRWNLKRDRLIWWIILHVTLWVLWGERNNMIFRREARAMEMLVAFICERVREWAYLLCNVSPNSSAIFALLWGLWRSHRLSVGCFCCTGIFVDSLTTLVHPFFYLIH